VLLALDGVDSGDLIGSGGDGKWTLKTTKVLIDGEYDVSARAVDAAGNEGPSSSKVRFIVDTVAPDTEIRAKPAKNHNSVVVQFILNAPEEPVELNTTFECKLVSHRYNKEIAGACSKAQGYDLEIDFEINDVNGKYTFSAAARDEAGNLDQTPISYDFDVLVEPPAPPEIISPVDGESVYDLTPTISGKTVEFGTVEFFIGGTKVGLAEADDEGLFTFKFSEPLEQTTHVLTARAINLASNRSEFSQPTSFTVFEPKPMAHAIGGGLGCAASGGTPWLALLGLLAGAAWSARRRRR
jgi:uncharacterized protein (TIGR03382 family)